MTDHVGGGLGRVGLAGLTSMVIRRCFDKIPLAIIVELAVAPSHHRRSALPPFTRLLQSGLSQSGVSMARVKAISLIKGIDFDTEGEVDCNLSATVHHCEADVRRGS